MSVTPSDRHAVHPSGAEGFATMLRRRVDGTFEVDEWGLDADLVALVEPVLGLRWRVSVEGHQHVPGTGPALVVYNRRTGLSEPFVVAQAVRAATCRLARPVGSPDVAPLGTLLRRLGGVLDQAAEVAGLLRADQIVAVPLGRELWSMHRAGSLRPDMLAAAADQHVMVVPAAVIGHETGRRWRVLFGPPVELPNGRAERPDVTSATDAVARRVQGLLDASA
jgi:hypothetical protein